MRLRCIWWRTLGKHESDRIVFTTRRNSEERSDFEISRSSSVSSKSNIFQLFFSVDSRKNWSILRLFRWFDELNESCSFEIEKVTSPTVFDATSITDEHACFKQIPASLSHALTNLLPDSTLWRQLNRHVILCVHVPITQTVFMQERKKSKLWNLMALKCTMVRSHLPTRTTRWSIKFERSYKHLNAPKNCIHFTLSCFHLPSPSSEKINSFMIDFYASLYLWDQYETNLYFSSPTITTRI